MSSISGIGSATSTYVNKTASDGDSAAVEAKESAATKLSEKLNGGQSKSTSANQSSNSNNLSQLKMYASQHMTASQIAQKLGIPISTIVQEARTAGITLNNGSSSSNSTNTAANAAVGKNVDTTA